MTSSSHQVLLNGKVALITGANTGIGKITALELALQGYHVFLACRSEEKTMPVLQLIEQRSQGRAKAEFLALDLGDLQSVKACANTFLQRGLPLDLLINNAGLAGALGKTQSGFELAFGVCHVGHFLLTLLLLPALKRVDHARVVVVSSRAHTRVKTLDFDSLQQRTQSPGGLKEYCQAKLANLLFAKGLAKRTAGSGIHVYALHPGVVATEVWRKVPRFLQPLIKLFMISPEKGAQTTLYCATSADVAHETGLYYSDQRALKGSPAGEDSQLADRLWLESEQWVANYLENSAPTTK